MPPEVWVPPQHVRDVRALIAHRMALCKRRVIALNRIRSVLNRYNFEQPDDLEAGNDWLPRIEADLSIVVRLLVADDFASLQPLNAGSEKAEGELARMSQSER
jgi:transposase